MSQQANINVRLDAKVKKQFDYICQELGLTMSSAINMFIKAVTRENRIPLDLSLDIPNEETKKAIEDVENGIGLSGPFETTEELMKSLMKDEDE